MNYSKRGERGVHETKTGIEVKKKISKISDSDMDSRKTSVVKQKTLSTVIKLEAIKSKPEIKRKHQFNYLNGKGDMANFSLPRIFTS